jgi:hypothetical protein
VLEHDARGNDAHLAVLASRAVYAFFVLLMITVKRGDEVAFIYFQF